MKHLLGNLALCATLLVAVPVGAHSAKHSDTVKALHGGQSLSAGPYHLELIAKDGELLLYVTDHSDKAIPTDGAKAKATIQHGYEKTNIQVELEPSGENTLKGTGAFTINPIPGSLCSSGYRNRRPTQPVLLRVTAERSRTNRRAPPHTHSPKH